MTSLQDLELAALNRSANLSRALKRELDSWVEQTAAAMLARWMIENREALLDRGLQTDAVDFLEFARRRKSA
ncbi:MAG: hypothetical protein NVS9B14_06530 [Candidatus Acidiferrum sp.]